MNEFFQSIFLNLISCLISCSVRRIPSRLFICSKLVVKSNIRVKWHKHAGSMCEMKVKTERNSFFSEETIIIRAHILRSVPTVWDLACKFFRFSAQRWQRIKKKTGPFYAARCTKPLFIYPKWQNVQSGALWINPARLHLVYMNNKNRLRAERRTRACCWNDFVSFWFFCFLYVWVVQIFVVTYHHHLRFAAVYKNIQTECF